MRKRVKRKIEQTFLEVEGKPVPVKIYLEERNGYRFSIGKNGAYLRLSVRYTSEKQSELRVKFEDWVRKQFSKKEGLVDRFAGKGYKSGDILKIGERNYLLKFEYTENKTHSAKIHGREIHLKLTKLDSELHLQKSIKHLLSRIVAQDFLPEISRRIAELNHQFFQKPIKKISLKYNLSNWGSCSSKGNINLSTRLLFAPDEVIDYVIIHELAHLLEMNHSSRFWKHVENAMPNYKEKEKWLKKNGHLCDF